MVIQKAAGKTTHPNPCLPQIVENCICTLRNLSYRLELELPPPRLIGGQELDGLLGSESPSKEVDSSCWGRKKKKKKKSLQEDTVSHGLLSRCSEQDSNQQKVCNVQICSTLTLLFKGLEVCAFRLPD